MHVYILMPTELEQWPRLPALLHPHETHIEAPHLCCHKPVPKTMTNKLRTSPLAAAVIISQSLYTSTLVTIEFSLVRGEPVDPGPARKSKSRIVPDLSPAYTIFFPVLSFRSQTRTNYTYLLLAYGHYVAASVQRAHTHAIVQVLDVHRLSM